MKKNKKRDKHNSAPFEEKTFFVGSKSTASATECTGLIQTPADSEEELESYTELYNIPAPKKDYPYK